MSYAPSQPARDAVAPDELAAFDAVLARFRSRATAAEADDAERFGQLGEESEVGTFFAALLHSPPLAAGLSELGSYYRGPRPGYTPAEREWVVEVVGHETGCRREIYAHLAEAVRFGVRAEALAALHADRLAELTADERQLTEYVRAVVRGTVK